MTDHPRSGVLHKTHKTAMAAMLDALRRVLPDREWHEGSDIEEIVRLIYQGDLRDAERVSALLALLKFTRPTLKAVDHSGTVAKVEATLTPKEIEAILSRDPFAKAIEVKGE